MTELQVAGEVAEVLGPDTIDRIRAEAPGWDDAECRDCGRPINLRADAASVVVLIAPAEMPGELAVMSLTHAACSASELRAMTWEEAQTYLQPDPEQTHDVHAVAAQWASPRGNRPVLLISFGAPVIATVADSGELTDAVAAALLNHGRERVTQMDTNPAARPDDLVCRYTTDPEQNPEQVGDRRPGRLEILLGRDELADTSVMFSGAAWRAAVQQTGELAIYVGPFDLHKWGNEVQADVVDQAMRSGRLIGCTTRAHITG